MQDDLKDVREKFMEFSTNTTKDLDAVRSQVSEVDRKASEAKLLAGAAQASVSNLRAKFEQRLTMFQSSLPSTPQLSAREATALFVDLSEDLEVSFNRIQQELKKMSIDASEPYYKGDEFQGMLWSKFPNVAKVEEVTAKLKASSIKC